MSAGPDGHVDVNVDEDGGRAVGRREFLAALAWTAFGAAQARSESVPRTSGKTVDRLRRISLDRRAALERNAGGRTPGALNRQIPEIDEVEVWNGAAPARPGKSLRLIAWNMERGRHWEGAVRLIRETEALRDPDIVLLGEMDLGMARSGNAHTTRALAAALGMNYAYGVEFLELTGGEIEERKLYPGENEWGYHGNAILARFPLRNVRMLRFPGIEKWYEGKGANESERVQKRLGGRIALFATLRLGRDVTVVATHLESSAKDSAMRKIQTGLLLDELRAYAKGTPVTLGGDLNAAPDEPMFEGVRAAGFHPEESNDLSVGTLQRVVDGQVAILENHLDYLLIRGLAVVRDATSPKVVLAAYPPGANGSMLGDHAIVTAKVELA
jgi:endonuclease/exonuclease/phosphatase family metal-dependent hydrolase